MGLQSKLSIKSQTSKKRVGLNSNLQEMKEFKPNNFLEMGLQSHKLSTKHQTSKKQVGLNSNLQKVERGYLFSGEKGTSAEPQVSPPPKASRSIISPAFNLPSSYISLIAIGIDAPEVFPYL